VDRCNSALRARLEGGGLLPREHPDMASWYIQVRVPGVRRHFVVVDCPGSTEGGAVGEMVSILLRRRLHEACVVVLVVKSDNLSPLTDPHQLSNLFGGPAPDRQALLVVTNIETEGARRDAESWLNEHALDTGALQIRHRLFVSARQMLAHQLLQQLPGRGFPPFQSEAFGSQSDEIKLCTQAVMSVDFTGKDEYESVRRNLPKWIEAAYSRSWSDNSKFIPAFEGFLDTKWPSLILDKIQRHVLDAARKACEEFQHDEENAKRSEVEVVSFQLKLCGALQHMGTFRQEALQAATSRQGTACERVNAALDVLRVEPTTRHEFWERLADATDATFADKYRACMNMMFTKALGPSDGVVDIRFDCPATAETFLHAFAAWAYREMANSQPGYAVADAAREWLDRELGAGHGISVPSGPEFEDGPSPRVYVPEGALTACRRQRAKVLQGLMSVLLVPHSLFARTTMHGFQARRGRLVRDAFRAVWSGTVVNCLDTHLQRVGHDAVAAVADEVASIATTSVEAALRAGLESATKSLEANQPDALAIQRRAECARVTLRAVEEIRI